MEPTGVCPLILDAAAYEETMDTLDLSRDDDARTYWVMCFDEMVQKFTRQAVKSQSTDFDVEERAEQFCKDAMDQVRSLVGREQGHKLSIRMLLSLNEHLLRQHGFPDPWLSEKRDENAKSVTRLRARLQYLDSICDWDEKWTELVKGLLAGNMFDWGAQAVSEILESDDSFGLQEALFRIQPRPWLIDGLDAWLERINTTTSKPHCCAAIFLDNSGADVVLGILPFARELLIRKTKVLLCANSEPALNDITRDELELVLEQCCLECDIIAEACRQKQLLVFSNGQSSPCLDFRNLSPELCKAMVDHRTDLLIIEGMGRALHTNLFAKFKCETLKLAVVKNKWLANRLGGDVFSVICKYETL